MHLGTGGVEPSASYPPRNVRARAFRHPTSGAPASRRALRPSCRRAPARARAARRPAPRPPRPRRRLSRRRSRTAAECRARRRARHALACSAMKRSDYGAHQRMDDGFEPLESRRDCRRARGELRAVDFAIAGDARKRRLDRADGLALVKTVHRGIGIVHRHACLARTCRAVVDLPMPIEPVRPRTNMVMPPAAFSSRRCSSKGRSGSPRIVK